MAEAKFKVGDRVVEDKSANGVDLVYHWNTYFRTSNGELVGGSFVVTSVSAHLIGCSNKAGCSLFFVSPTYLKPAPLTIEAGKFYKTRDGRKVGPMHEYYPDGLCFGADGKFNGGLWHPDGSPWYAGAKDSPTLIDEWIDEPKASNDNGPFASLIGKTVTVQVKTPDKPKFKVGDRVTLARSFDGAAFVGATGTVGKRGMYAPFVDILWDRDELSNGQFDGGYFPDYFDLAPATKPTAIVALIENGEPKPSAFPHVHATEADAAKEAARLASKHKGQQFGVFVLTTTKQEPAPSYVHEWQRLAVKGDKIAAIKELRSITGLGLKASKDAVEYWLANDEQRSRLAA